MIDKSVGCTELERSHSVVITGTTWKGSSTMTEKKLNDLFHDTLKVTTSPNGKS